MRQRKEKDTSSTAPSPTVDDVVVNERTGEEVCVYMNGIGLFIIFGCLAR